MIVFRTGLALLLSDVHNTSYDKLLYKFYCIS